MSKGVRGICFNNGEGDMESLTPPKPFYMN